MLKSNIVRIALAAFAVCATAYIVWPLVAQYPLALALLLCLGVAWKKEGPTGAVKSLLLSALCGALAAALGSSLAKIAGQFSPFLAARAVGQVDIASWLTLTHLSAWANSLGRIGMLAGAVLGAFWKFGTGTLHDSRHVHGLEVAGSNPEKGTTRWAGDRDLGHVAEFGPPREGRGGTVVGKLGGRIVRLQPEKCKPPLPQHTCVVAGTGAGKSYSFGIPNIIAAAMEGESLVATDPKGELACLLAPWLKSKGYKVYIFNLAYPQWSLCWNPVIECRDDEEITAFATAIVQNAAKDTSGYFVMKEIQLLKALIYLLKADFPEEQAHLRSALSLLSWPEEALDARFTAAYQSGKLPQTGYEEWRGAVSSNLDNATSGLTAKLGVVRAESIAKLLSRQEIDLSAIGKEKAALFCVLPIGAAHLKPVLASFYYFFFRRLYGLAAENGGKLPNPVRFLLDEFANVGQIPGFVEVISTARSLGIKIQFILQGLKQLQDCYGTAEAEAILSNCPIQEFLGGDDATTTRYFSSRLGSAAVWAKSERESRTLSTSLGVLMGHTSVWNLPRRAESKSVVRRSLMEPEELSRMNPMAAVCLVRWCLPMYFEKLGWTELPQAGEIQSLAVSRLADLCPTRPDAKLELPPMPELPEEDDAPRARKRGSAAPTPPDDGDDSVDLDGVDEDVEAIADELGI